MDGFDFNGWHLVAIGLLIYLAIAFYNSRLDQSSMGGFSMTLQIATLTIFIIQMVLSLENYRQQVADRKKAYNLKYASLAQMKMNDVDKMFFGNPILDRLYYQMYQGNRELEYAKRLASKPEQGKGNGNDNSQTAGSQAAQNNNQKEATRLKAEHHACSIIFQTMADIYMTGINDWQYTGKHEDMVEWCTTFKKWLRSPILQLHWQTLSDEHHPKFRAYIQHLCSQIPLDHTNIS